MRGVTTVKRPLVRVLDRLNQVLHRLLGIPDGHRSAAQALVVWKDHWETWDLLNSSYEELVGESDFDETGPNK